MTQHPFSFFKPLVAFFLLSAFNACWAGEVTVYAAASLTNVLGELAKTYEASHGVKTKFSFAASGALAKQIEAGAPADLFISADTKWMDYLDGKGKIDRSSRVNLVGNTLVLIAPKGKGFPVRFDKGFDFAEAFEGKLCTGQTESVPVGIYAKEALVKLGWWDAIQNRVVGTDDVRAALDLVGRRECIGIVYATDAKVSNKVEVIASFPEELHSPIVYPAALVTQSGEAKAFFEFIKGSSKLFVNYGFKKVE
jgi:molybdate transport system substrate-binding protein